MRRHTGASGSSAPTIAAIELVDVVKEFRGERAVDGLSLRVPRGQVCAILGPNGAGKTTTMHMLLGLTLPTSGTVRVLGHDLATERSAAMRRANFMATYVSYPYRLTVREVLRVYAELYEVDQPAEAIGTAIDAFDLRGLVDKRIQGLSSGQQTLVGLAKSVVNRPDVLLLDEPTASLDPEHATDVRATLRRLADEWHMTIVITSHNMPEVERLADRVVFLSNGRVIADAPPLELRERFRAADLEEVFIRVAREGRTELAP